MRHVWSLLPLLAACAPGEVRWGTGEDWLRTALYVENDPVAEGAGTRVLLSTGIFGCDLPAEADPAAQAEALLDLAVAACREDARHLAIRLWRDPGLDRVGVYRGQAGAGPAALTELDPRLASVDYVGVEEAALTLSDLPQFGEALGGTYRPTEVARASAAGTGGQVRVRGDEVLVGAFDFPDLHVSGRFRAERCAAGSALFDLAFTAPTLSCP